ncbi:2-phosphosulfolactate phosphatase [Leifsonia shinshuensis]|uniref:2-phosphosulfolactate phosphatase n=1 Tax=Leifsonia shinshuensis TaxID=150026 RepID=UPI0028628FF3|nr:2-phosphosulfolactate phosphatase [Leifsonia shinshuensis]MDR6971530.1 hypothetical protein [Leifsonia shinshuensis]
MSSSSIAETTASVPAASVTTGSVPAAHRQAKYQVRFDTGPAGLAAIASDADVIVLVDALPPIGGGAALDAPGDAAVLTAGLTDAEAVASWILAEQVWLGRRAMIALVAVGESAHDGSPRFAVEDLLAAGAVVDALAALGIDYASPEAAAACAAFTGLRGAVAHMLTASVTGQERIAAGASPAEVAAAGRVGSSDAVTVLRASRKSGARPAE